MVNNNNTLCTTLPQSGLVSSGVDERVQKGGIGRTVPARESESAQIRPGLAEWQGLGAVWWRLQDGGV